MKKILRDTCVFAALMILSVFGLSIIWTGFTAEIKLVFQLFGLAFILSAANHVFDEMTSLPMLHSYIAKYFAATCIVMLYGFIVGWFFTSNFWMAFIYVAIVFVFAYFLDSFKTRKDIEFINSRIRDRKAPSDTAQNGKR